MMSYLESLRVFVRVVELGSITAGGRDMLQQHFGRHVDKETGVGEWTKPFDVTQEFVFAGTGKKGAY